MSGSLKREADFKREIRRLREQRDEHRALPAKLEALRREVKRWQESSTKYAEENTRLRDEVAKANADRDFWRQRYDAAVKLSYSLEAENTPLVSLVAALVERTFEGRCACGERVFISADGTVESHKDRNGNPCICGRMPWRDVCRLPLGRPAGTGTTSDNRSFRKLDQAGAVGCKPEGLTVHRPDPEGLPPRSTEERSGG